jgi:hypothetical protein
MKLHDKIILGFALVLIAAMIIVAVYEMMVMIF